jgi:hypothetical protein
MAVIWDSIGQENIPTHAKAQVIKKITSRRRSNILGKIQKWVFTGDIGAK